MDSRLASLERLELHLQNMEIEADAEIAMDGESQTVGRSVGRGETRLGTDNGGHLEHSTGVERSSLSKNQAESSKTSHSRPRAGGSDNFDGENMSDGQDPHITGKDYTSTFNEVETIIQSSHEYIQALLSKDSQEKLDSDTADCYCSSVSSDLISFSEGSTVSDGDYEIDEDLNNRLAVRVAAGDFVSTMGAGYVRKAIGRRPIFLPSEFCDEGFSEKDSDIDGRLGGDMGEDWPLEFNELVHYLEQQNLEPTTLETRPTANECCEAMVSQKATLENPACHYKSNPTRKQVTFDQGIEYISGNNACFNRNPIKQGPPIGHFFLEAQSRNGPRPIPTIPPPQKIQPNPTASPRTQKRKARRIRMAEKSSILALQSQAQISSPTALNFGGQSAVSDSSPGLVEENQNREVRVGNLPAGITLKTILSKVRGGLLDRACYRKGAHTVTLVFFEASAARNFYRFLQTFNLAYPVSSDLHCPLHPAKLFPFTKSFMFDPCTPERNEAVLNRGATRCFFIGFLPDTIGVRKIESDIMERLERLQRNSRRLEGSDELIESIEVVLEPGNLKRTACVPADGRRGRPEGRKDGMCVIVKLASISLAFGAIGDFRSRAEYLGVELSYVEDDCAGPLLLPDPVRSPHGKTGIRNPGARHVETKSPPIGPRQTGLPVTIKQKAGISPRDHEYREVFLGNLPLAMDPHSLVGWIRGGQVDTIHIYHNSERSAKEAVIFFVSHEGARRYYKFITTHGMYILGRKVVALTFIPEGIKTNHRPLSFLRGQPPNGITRFVRVSGVKDHYQLLEDMMGTCEQRPVIENLEKSRLGSNLRNVTIQFMGMGDAVRAMIELKRFNSYRSLPSTYVRDPCGDNVMSLARFANRRQRKST